MPNMGLTFEGAEFGELEQTNILWGGGAVKEEYGKKEEAGGGGRTFLFLFCWLREKSLGTLGTSEGVHYDVLIEVEGLAKPH